MTIELNLSLIIAVFSIFGTIITAILFFGKLRWDTHKQAEDIKKNSIDINNLGSKFNDMQQHQAAETKVILAKIDALDKNIISMSVTLSYLKEAVERLKSD
jgi:uncharacterized DUF497 family protein